LLLDERPRPSGVLRGFLRLPPWYEKKFIRNIFHPKIHQIAFGGRATFGPAGSLQRSLIPPSWIKGSLLLREGDGKGRDGGEKRKREGKGRGGGEEGRVRGSRGRKWEGGERERERDGEGKRREREGKGREKVGRGRGVEDTAFMDPRYAPAETSRDVLVGQ